MIFFPNLRRKYYYIYLFYLNLYNILILKKSLIFLNGATEKAVLNLFLARWILNGTDNI